MQDLTHRLKAEATAIGFDMARVCRPDAVGHVAADLAGFLDKGYHGQMGWLAEPPSAIRTSLAARHECHRDTDCQAPSLMFFWIIE